MGTLKSTCQKMNLLNLIFVRLRHLVGNGLRQVFFLQATLQMLNINLGTNSNNLSEASFHSVEIFKTRDRSAAPSGSKVSQHSLEMSEFNVTMMIRMCELPKL